MYSEFQNGGLFLHPGRPVFFISKKVSRIMPNDTDLQDDFDFAIEALETARIAMRNDRQGAEKLAANLLAGKRQLKRAEAQGLIAQATRYLDG